MTDELVHYELVDGVATITLDSPHNRNALSRQLVTELFDALDRSEADEDARVVLIRSADRVFCSGADLSEAAGEGMAEGTKALVAPAAPDRDAPPAGRHPAGRAGPRGRPRHRRGQRRGAVQRRRHVRVHREPARAGPGGDLADRAAAADQPRGRRDVPDRAHVRRARGDRDGPGHPTVPPDELDGAVAEVCARARKAHPQGLRETKALLARDLVANIDAHAEEMAALSARLFGSDEAREAMTAFLNRKK